MVTMISEVVVINTLLVAPFPGLRENIVTGQHVSATESISTALSICDTPYIIYYDIMQISFFCSRVSFHDEKKINEMKTMEAKSGKTKNQ